VFALLNLSNSALVITDIVSNRNANQINILNLPNPKILKVRSKDTVNLIWTLDIFYILNKDINNFNIGFK